MALPGAVVDIIEFVSSTSEEVTINVQDDFISYCVGYYVYYIKDGYEISSYFTADISKINCDYVYNGLYLLFPVHHDSDDTMYYKPCYIEMFKSIQKRIELAALLQSCKSLEELNLKIKMHEALL